jgi:5-methylthioadenosine/S-adenosylhomocysteine deaminase
MIYSLLNPLPPLKIEPHQSILIRHLTILCGSDFKEQHDSFLQVKHGRIESMGEDAAAQSLVQSNPSGYIEIDGSEFVAIPGLVNAHTHAPMGFFRGLGRGKTAMIENFLFPAEKSLTPELVAPLSYSFIVDGLRRGVTCFFDHYYFSEAIANAFKRLKVRAFVGETAADLGGAFPGSDSVDRTIALCEKLRPSPLVKAVIAPHACDTVSKSMMVRLKELAEKFNLPIHLHMAQTSGEHDRVIKREGVTPVQFAKECGILGPKTLAVHLTNASPKDLATLKDHGTSVGWCPGSTVIYDKLADVKNFYDLDLNLALGTDCAASNDSSDMLQELRTAYLFAKDRRVPDEKITAAKLLSLTTINTYKAFGFDNDLGTIDPGKLADIVFMKKSINHEPFHDTAENVIFSMGSQAVEHVMIQGEFRLWNQRLVQIDEQELKKEYLAANAEIHRRLNLAKN